MGQKAERQGTGQALSPGKAGCRGWGEVIAMKTLVAKGKIPRSTLGANAPKLKKPRKLLCKAAHSWAVGIGQVLGES